MLKRGICLVCFYCLGHIEQDVSAPLLLQRRNFLGVIKAMPGHPRHNARTYPVWLERLT